MFFGVNLKCASCHDSFIDHWKLDDAYGLAAVIADKPLEIHRCDKPTGKTAGPKFLFPELGTIDAERAEGRSGSSNSRSWSRTRTTAGSRGRSPTASGSGSWAAASSTRST